MKFEGNFVCTKDKEVEIGKEYQYYESMPTCICNVLIEDMHNNEDGYGFKFKVTKALTNNVVEGNIFDVAAAHGNYAYGGMWRLYDKDTYTNTFHK